MEHSCFNISGNGNPKKLLIFSQKKSFAIFSQEKAFLVFQEMETFPKIHFISGNLHFGKTKFLIFQRRYIWSTSIVTN